MSELHPISRRSGSIALSTGLSAMTALLIIVASVVSTIYSVEDIESTKQQETLRHVLQQHGNSLGRELKVQTYWSEGYKNTRQGNSEWMNEFYGPYLDKLLGYQSLYVLNGKDEGIYSYNNGNNSDGAAFEAVRADIADLLHTIRHNDNRPNELYHVIEAEFDLGENQKVTHRFISDLRSIGGAPYMVVISTILPDSPQSEPIESPPYLMVAMNPIDQQVLQRLGANFGFAELQWGQRTSAEFASLAVRGVNGTLVGQLSWLSDHPGWTFGKRMLPGLSIAGLLLIGLAGLLVRRNYAQAASLERYSRRLAEANDMLEKRVDARTRELKATFDNVAQGVVLIDPHQRILIANRQATQLMELASDEQLQSEIEHLHHGVYGLTSTERRNLPDGTKRLDLIRASGRSVEVRQTPLADGGSVLTISDVSALKKRQTELEAATNAANAANRAKSRFLSTMSHEMRTPLNGIIGALELIGKTAMTADQQQLVQLATKSSEALLVHINDVLDFSKLEAEKFELTSEPFDLQRTIIGVRDIVQSQAEHRKNKLIVEIDPQAPRHVLGDAVRLRQILLNLVSNANKFTRDGTITISVLPVGGTADVPLVEIAVKDTGVGIPADKLSSLFKEFSMIESEYKRHGGGTGLGLAISKRLAEAMAGIIEVESIVGEGSVFKLQIPFSVASGPALENNDTQNPADPHATGLNILLVDDNATNRLVGSRLLETAGHQITTANDGRRAVELVTQTAFDIVLMDVSMPEMDGLEATSEIRKLALPWANVPVIALTANAVIGDREKFLAAGMTDYVSKPFRLRDLQEKISRYTSGRRILEDVAHAPAVPPQVLPLIDEKELENLIGETSTEIVAAIIEEYVGELATRKVSLNEAISEKDYVNLEKICHAISGASRSVGASQLAECARAIELASATGDASALKGIVELIDPLIDLTLNAFKQRGPKTLLQSAA